MSEIKAISKKPEKVELASLCYQFIPGLITHDIWMFDMSLPNSPQVECARLLLEHGRDWGKLKDCRFAQDRRYRFKFGQVKWTEEYIKQHILGSRYDILRSIQKRGFDKKLNSKQPVAILKEPFWKTRFGYTADWLNGYEIYHGGRRCAAMYALGYETVPALWCKDKKPGSNDMGKFKDKLGEILWTTTPTTP